MSRQKLKICIYALTGRIADSFGVTCKRPLFLTGTGRCGSTLLFRILKSHREIVAYRRSSNKLWHPNSFPFAKARVKTPAFVVNPRVYTELSIKNWPHRHRQSILNIFAGFHLIHARSKLLLVKSAMVSFMIEEIDSMFPDAKFIHIYRNGPSVVESLFKKEWNKHSAYMPNEREFRLHCARYWNSCIMEINRVKESLSLENKNTVFEISYEDLCNNPKQVLGDLGAYIGLDVEGFNFDISRISSRNYKVGDYTNDKRWTESLEIMYSAMKLKGYLQ